MFHEYNAIEPPQEPPQEEEFATCAGCGLGIWDGEEYLEIGGAPVHDDWQCAYDYVLKVAERRVAGEGGG